MLIVFLELKEGKNIPNKQTQSSRHLDLMMNLKCDITHTPVRITFSLWRKPGRVRGLIYLFSTNFNLKSNYKRSIEFPQKAWHVREWNILGIEIVCNPLATSDCAACFCVRFLANADHSPLGADFNLFNAKVQRIFWGLLVLHCSIKLESIFIFLDCVCSSSNNKTNIDFL